MQLNKFIEFGRKIVCVGRNYRDHVLELGNKVPEKPVIFMKPSTAYVTEGNPIKIPKGCQDLHHEVELGVIISRKGSKIPASEAMSYVGGYTLCLDITARDLQNEAKKAGLPWEIAKGFDTSCPVGEFLSTHRIPDPHNVQLWCKVNGKLRQDGNTDQMIFRIPELIDYVSNFFTLEPGDVILTGTPAGVGPVVAKDTLEAGIGDVTKMSFIVE